MQGYWKASVENGGNLVEVATGPTPEEASDNAVALGYDPNVIILEFYYDQPRGPSGIHRL